MYPRLLAFVIGVFGASVLFTTTVAIAQLKPQSVVPDGTRTPTPTRAPNDTINVKVHRLPHGCAVVRLYYGDRDHWYSWTLCRDAKPPRFDLPKDRYPRIGE